VAEHGHAGLEVRSILKRRCDLIADAAETLETERVLLRLTAFVSDRWDDAFGDDDDRVSMSRAVTRPDYLDDLVYVVFELWDEDVVSTAGKTSVGGNPPFCTAHDFDNDHSVVCLCRRCESVDRVRRDLDSGFESERDVCASDVVVDRFRHADYSESFIGESHRRSEGSVPAYHDDAVYTVP
jgi:hypothetical protein